MFFLVLDVKFINNGLQRNCKKDLKKAYLLDMKL